MSRCVLCPMTYLHLLMSLVSQEFANRKDVFAACGINLQDSDESPYVKNKLYYIYKMNRNP